MLSSLTELAFKSSKTVLNVVQKGILGTKTKKKIDREGILEDN